ncbi:MAG: patatin-like phospholipase family protein [Propionibacteriaceae bacterium]|jgi:NTE family protein|nr:patatin-like phospholipase family protein [Propionibacteriaceae bacterium]
MAKVALVLGSGGARGLAQIGAIEVLKEHGHEIAAIAGTSVGALVGGLEAVGKLEEYRDWILTFKQRDVLFMMDPALGSGGLVKAEKVFTTMRELYGDAQIEDLPFPYTAVATDIGARREVWFQSGPLDVAVRASVSIPGFFMPVVVNGRLLVDGGVVNPVPMEPLLATQADFTMAVTLSGGAPKDVSSSPAKESAKPQPSSQWGARFSKIASGIWDNDFVNGIIQKFHKDDAQSEEPELSAWDQAIEPPPDGLSIAKVMSLTFDTMGSMLTRYRMAAQVPDVLVEVPESSAATMDFHKGEELIALGRSLTEEALDKYELEQG